VEINGYIPARGRMIQVVARELDREAWRWAVCKPGSDKDLRRDKSLVKAARIWAAIEQEINRK
jgi:hypothetical protein